MGHKCHRDLWHWKTYSQRRCWLLLMYVQYVSICTFKGPILYFSSISHSRQRSNNSVFKTSCHKPIYGPEFQPSKSRSGERLLDENRLLLCLHLEMLKTSLCQHLPCLLHAPHTRLSPWEVFSLALGESSAHTVTNVPLNSLGWLVRLEDMNLVAQPPKAIPHALRPRVGVRLLRLY